MNAITYTAARTNLTRAMDRVCNDQGALVITRSGKPTVVMLSLEHFTALEESANLLRSPTNAKRLMGAIEQLSVSTLK